MSGDTSDQGSPRGRKGTRSKITLFFQVFIYVAVMASITFLIAGRWDWWMAWAYFVAYLAMMLVGVMIPEIDIASTKSMSRAERPKKSWSSRSGSSTEISPISSPMSVAV